MQLFEMPSPFETEWGRVLLLEPPHSNAVALRQQLLDETYPKPFVVDDGDRRFLYFNVRLMQSAMLKKTPNALDLRYTQKMMSFLLFCPRPKRIVLIGVGGGSLVKFCHHRLPGAHLTAIEIDEHVLALREAFAVPPDGPRLQIMQADGVEYLESAEKGIDVLLVDAFDHIGFAQGFADRQFFELAYAKLSGKGVMVVNMAGERESYDGLISQAMHVFDGQVLMLSIPDDGNHLLLAFKEAAFEPRWRWLHNHAKELRATYGLDFPAFAEKLERSAKLGLARREFLRGR